jgi:hypothetical protein
MPKSVFKRENISNKKREKARVAITKMLRCDLCFIGARKQ